MKESNSLKVGDAAFVWNPTTLKFDRAAVIIRLYSIGLPSFRKTGRRTEPFPAAEIFLSDTQEITTVPIYQVKGL